MEIERVHPEKLFETDSLEKRRFETQLEKESDELQVEGMKIIIPSNIIDFWNTLEVLVGLKLSGHTDILTDTSNLIDKF